MIRIYKEKDYEAMSRRAANVIAAEIIRKPNCVLGLATGSSPIGTYKELIARYELGDLDFSQVSSINLDEYKGLSPENDQSYRYFMNTNLFDHINIDKANTNVPNGLAADPDAECARYDALIEELGGVDLCLGGLGINGHVAFNEAAEEEDPITPDEFADLPTRVLPISRETKTINAYGYQRGDLYGMPEWCITLGMKQILSAKKVYIALNRPWQNGPLKHTILDAESAYVPASLLRRCPEVIFCGMEEVTKGIL